MARDDRMNFRLDKLLTFVVGAVLRYFSLILTNKGQWLKAHLPLRTPKYLHSTAYLKNFVEIYFAAEDGYFYSSLIKKEHVLQYFSEFSQFPILIKKKKNFNSVIKKIF